MRIAYLADPLSNNGRYRGILPMTALAGCRKHAVHRLFTDDAQPIEMPLDGVDVVFIHRYCNRWTLELARKAKQAGAAVLWDDDDDIGSMPKSSVSYKRLGGMAWEQRLSRMRRVFDLADLVTAPSPVLGERFRSWGARSTDIVENYLADPCLEVKRRSHDGTTIGWIAALEHAMDVQRVPIVPALQRILDERQDIRVVSIGLRLGLRSARYDHTSGVPFSQLTQHTAEFDIAIAPLAETDFNRSRSNIKLKEYAAGGTPWLASPIGPYADMGEKQGGRLVCDDDWYPAIVRLIDRPRERRKLAKRATRWAAGEAMSKNVAVWEAKLAAAIERSTTLRRIA